MSTSESGDHIIGRIELGLSADEASAAANSDDALLIAEADIVTAGAAASAAHSLEERLAAELLLQAAHIRAIGAMAADSRFAWEIGLMTDSGS